MDLRNRQDIRSKELLEWHECQVFALNMVTYSVVVSAESHCEMLAVPTQGAVYSIVFR